MWIDKLMSTTWNKCEDGVLLLDDHNI